MDSKSIRYPRKISFGLNRRPHRGPYAWEIESTPQELEERGRRTVESARINSEPLSPEEVSSVIENYRRSLGQMAAIAVEASEITSIAKIAETIGVSEPQIQLLLQKKSDNLSIEELLRIIVACGSVVTFDFGY